MLKSIISTSLELVALAALLACIALVALAFS